MLEAKRPGLRKWGQEWFSAATVESREKAMQDSEAAMTLLAKQLADCRGRMEQHTQELQAARLGHGVRSAKDVSRSLNDDEKELKDKQALYEKAAATIDSVRPKYPQLLLPIAMGETTPPPIASASTPPPPESMARAGPLAQQQALPQPPAPVVASPTPAQSDQPITQAISVPAPSDQPSSPRSALDSPTSGVRGPTVTEGIGDDQLRQCQVGADGVITVAREVTLMFHGTERRDYMLTGEAFLGGGGDNGGIVFYLREQDTLHRYELSGGGMRAKRVLLKGQMVPKFEYPFSFDTARDRWVKFRILANGDRIEANFDGKSGVALGPLSADGKNSVVLQPGAKLRNVQVVKTSDQGFEGLHSDNSVHGVASGEVPTAD